MKISNLQLFLQNYNTFSKRLLSNVNPQLNDIILLNHTFLKDEYTNITHKVVGYLDKKIYLQNFHPLSLVRQRIVNYFYNSFVNGRGNPIFSIHDNLPPIVSTSQNFDSLLIPKDHTSRSKSDCYYINSKNLLRAHMTAHQSELIQAGLNNFLIIGDVYRRDEIDRTHFPVFHQVDAVRLQSRDQIFPKDENLNIFEEGNNTAFPENEYMEEMFEYDDENDEERVTDDDEKTGLLQEMEDYRNEREKYGEDEEWGEDELLEDDEYFNIAGI